MEQFSPEILTNIFGFLDLSAWKKSRRVSHEWNRLLRYTSYKSKFVLRFNDPDDGAPIEVFRKTFSTFPIVEILDRIGNKSMDEVLEFLENIGKGTLSLTFLCYYYHHLNVLLKFPKLTKVKCDSIFLLKQPLPLTLKTIILNDVTQFMSEKRIEEIEGLIQDASKDFFIDTLRFLSDDEEEEDDDDEQEYVKIDKTLLKIVKETDAEEIRFSPLNLRTIKKIELGAITEFWSYNDETDDAFNYEGWRINKRKKETFLKNLQKMPKLRIFSAENEYVGERDCFFTHNQTENLGVEEFIYSGDVICNDCLINVIKSFPNLKTITIYEELELDFQLILRANLQLEVINFSRVSIQFEPLLALPESCFKNLSRLKKLNLGYILLSETDWKLMIQKWPKSDNVTDLGLRITDCNFKVIYDFFTKFPNVETFKLRYIKGLKTPEVTDLFKLWSQLGDVELDLLNQSYFKTQEFVDAIAPFAKKLVRLKIENANESDSDDEEEEEEEMSFDDILSQHEIKKYLKVKIATLRWIQIYDF